MALLLAPYNDSMRLGMGFNSYTQTMCIDNAVDVTNVIRIRDKDPSQIVTYSSKFVNRLSDVVGSMNISYCTSIKKGTVDVAGSSTAIDEEKIKSSDLNAVVSVKVVNQTIIASENAKFNELSGFTPGTQQFNDAFGDCYISGFIEGGDFNGIISIRVLDRSKVEGVTQTIRKAVTTGSGAEFSLDADMFSGGTSNSSALNETETTISVSWMGGGQVKDPKDGWDMNSVYQAAAAFPSLVAQTPQRTWAILTKYKANRSFNQSVLSRSFSPLMYDSIASYTTELFENYMEYKQLIKIVQHIMTSRDTYQVQPDKTNAITLDMATLVAVRAALRVEMNKIVEAVDVLAKDPGCLKRNAQVVSESRNSLVQRILKAALEGINQSTPLTPPSSTSSSVNSEHQTDPQAVLQDVGDQVATRTDTKADSSVPKSTVDIRSSQIPTAASTSSEVDTKPTPPQGDAVRQLSFDFSKLIAPEVWSDLMPVAKHGQVAGEGGASTMPASLVGGFPLPPNTGDIGIGTLSGTKQIKVLGAVCGTVDVTDIVDSWVMQDQTLQISSENVKELPFGAWFEELAAKKIKVSPVLVILYKYSDSDMKVLAVKVDDVQDVLIIDQQSREHPRAVETGWNLDTWSLVALVDGTKLIRDEQSITKVQDQLRQGKDTTQQRSFEYGQLDATTAENMPALHCNQVVVFYRQRKNGQIRFAASYSGGPPLLLTADVAANQKIPQLQQQVLNQKAEIERRNQNITDLRQQVLNQKAEIERRDQNITDLQQQISKRKAEIELRDSKLKRFDGTYIVKTLPFSDKLDKRNNLHQSFSGSKVLLWSCLGQGWLIMESDGKNAGSGYVRYDNDWKNVVASPGRGIYFEKVDPRDEKSPWTIRLSDNSMHLTRIGKPNTSYNSVQWSPKDTNDPGQLWFIGGTTNRQSNVVHIISKDTDDFYLQASKALSQNWHQYGGPDIRKESELEWSQYWQVMVAANDD